MKFDKLYKLLGKEDHSTEKKDTFFAIYIHNLGTLSRVTSINYFDELGSVEKFIKKSGGADETGLKGEHLVYFCRGDEATISDQIYSQNLAAALTFTVEKYRNGVKMVEEYIQQLRAGPKHINDRMLILGEWDKFIRDAQTKSIKSQGFDDQDIGNLDAL